MRVREFVAFAHGRVLEGRRVDRCIGGGLQSVVDPGRWPADQILTDGVRYRQATAYLAKRHDNFTFMLPTLDGTSFAIDNPYSPLAASLTLGFSPNIQFPIDQIGLAANLAAATAFIAPVIASCSPFAAGRIGSWCSRIPMWAYGIDPDAELTTFAPGGYFSAPGRESVMEWIDFIMKGEQVLEQEEVGESKATGEFPAINLMIGTRWVQVGRIRFALQEGAFNVWFESRPWDAQLFPWDNFVILIFFAGLLAGLLREVASAEELIPYEDAKNAFLECVQLGHCELPWRAQKRSAREVIKNELVETARRGLVAEGLYDELAEQALEAISSRCDGRTGAHFMLDWMKAWAGAFPTWEHALGKLSFEVGGAHLWPKLFNGVHHYVGAPR